MKKNDKVEKRYEIGARYAKIKAEFCENSNKKFAEKVGIGEKQASNYCGGTKNPGAKMNERVLAAFPQVNRVWFLTGVGDMRIDNHPAGPSINTVNQHGDNTQNNTLADVDVAKLVDTIHSQQETIKALIDKYVR